VTRLEWSEQSLLGLEQLRLTHSLSADSRTRIEQSAGPLAQFPRLGPELQSRPEGELRFLIGPWPWLVIVYLYRPNEDRLVIVSIEDGRAAAATISAQRRS
jgi:plasmid stabilization system protein ParE